MRFSEVLTLLILGFVANCMAGLFLKYEAQFDMGFFKIDRSYIKVQFNKFGTWYLEKFFFQFQAIAMTLIMACEIPPVWTGNIPFKGKIIFTLINIPLMVGFCYITWNTNRIVAFLSKKFAQLKNQSF